MTTERLKNYIELDLPFPLCKPSSLGYQPSEEVQEWLDGNTKSWWKPRNGYRPGLRFGGLEDAALFKLFWL